MRLIRIIANLKVIEHGLNISNIYGYLISANFRGIKKMGGTGFEPVTSTV